MPINLKDFKEPREQDAQEFLLFLLNRLHDENSLMTGNPNPHESKITSIFEGILRTQLLCPQCISENQRSCYSMFKNHSKSSKGNMEVFLSLSLPIPVQMDQLKAATDTVDSNASDLNVVFNEIIDCNPVCSCRAAPSLFLSATQFSAFRFAFRLSVTGDCSNCIQVQTCKAFIIRSSLFLISPSIQHPLPNIITIKQIC